MCLQKMQITKMLGLWVKSQRQLYKYYKAGDKEKSRGMCEKRISKLESIGFHWVGSRKRKHT